MNNHQIIKGPQTPYLWQIFQLRQNPIQTMESWKTRYGDVFQIPSLRNPIINVSDPRIIQKIFTAPSETIEHIQTNIVFKILLGEKSLIFLPETQHQYQRKQVFSTLGTDNLNHWGQKIQEITLEVISREVESKSNCLIRPLMKEISLKVLLAVIVGNAEHELVNRLYKLLLELFTLFETPAMALYFLFPILQRDWFHWQKLQNLQQEIASIIFTLIKNYELDPTNQAYSLLAGLSKSELDNQEKSALIKTIIFAGFEATAAALSWSLYWINFLPEVKHKLLKEIAPYESNYTEEILKLPYLDAVSNEVLRITPPAINIFSRYVRQEMVIEDYVFPAGAELTSLTYLVHHQESIYPEPEEFRPERFWEKQYSPYEFIPFGGGLTRCLGARLAKLEMCVVLFTLFKHFTWELPAREKVKSGRHGVVMIPPRDLSFEIQDALVVKNK